MTNAERSPEESISRRFFIAGVLFLLGLAGFAAVFRLDRPSLAMDEAVTWNNVRSDWAFLADKARTGEDCGGIFYGAMTKIIVDGAGDSETVLRSPAVGCYMLFVLLVIIAGRLMAGRMTSLCAGALAVLHPISLFYARHARAYTLFLACDALVLAGLMARDRGFRRVAAWALAMASVIAVLTHGFGLFVVGAAMGGVLVIELRERGRFAAAVRATPL